ncbi:MAG TPA: carbohydrate porin [Thermoanaerobaculia bacterium]|nr:carbohydrate porin [Thermoanaerobaculia bacterium]
MRAAGIGALCLFGLAPPCFGEEPGAESSSVPGWVPRMLGAQFTYIGQHLQRFHAAYSGARSLKSTGDSKETDTYGMYFGSQVVSRLQFYLDLEMARGHGVSNAEGLAGITNGDVIRQGSVDLGQSPYVARAYFRYSLPLSNESEAVERGQDHVASREATSRLEMKAGKFALTDDFDVNRYANATRTQFMNWSLFNNTSWDYAADTRGFTNGILIAWVHPGWALRFASMQMPTVANGNVFDHHVDQARGDNVELTWGPAPAGTVVRLLAFENHGRMGSYREAIAIAALRRTVPDIAADDRPGRTKVGFGINLEQPLAAGGETGLFARAGWNDGKNEDFVFTEVDRSLSLGGQVSGRAWRRGGDRLGIAATVHGLSRDHRAYLAAGGLGFLLGDGRLSYGYEEIAEVYYCAQIGPYVQIGPDFQYVRNAGYNRDRGPARVLSVRLNLHY